MEARGSSAVHRAPAVLFLCTGNAARSVMAGAAWSSLGDSHAVTAGTLVIEGQPMSWRTRQALEQLGVPVPNHRSKQVRDADLSEVDLVVALAVEHVAHVRREHPEAADRTGTLRRLCRDLPRTRGSLQERVASLRLADVELEEWEDVVDPAGGDAAIYQACADEVVALVRDLHQTLH